MTRKEQLEDDKASIEKYIADQKRNIELSKKEIHFAQKRLKLVNEHIEAVTETEVTEPKPAEDEDRSKKNA